MGGGGTRGLGYVWIGSWSKVERGIPRACGAFLGAAHGAARSRGSNLWFDVGFSYHLRRVLQRKRPNQSTRRVCQLAPAPLALLMSRESRLLSYLASGCIQPFPDSSGLCIWAAHPGCVLPPRPSTSTSRPGCLCGADPWGLTERSGEVSTESNQTLMQA